MSGGTDRRVELPLYQIDAFTDRLFLGNPAAVCPLDSWLPDSVMQSIALENNLPETAFIVPNGSEYGLRWFTPASEVALCGHATLATAYVIFNYLRPELDQVTFQSSSGPLVVERGVTQMSLNFPALDYTPAVDPPAALLRALGHITPVAVYESMDYFVVYENETQLQSVTPDLALLKTIDRRGVVISAPGRSTDFASRFFAPKLSIPEDPITGSAHCTLVPYWATRLGKSRLRACQYSPRLGETLTIYLECEQRDDRVLLYGSATPYMVGTIYLPATELAKTEGAVWAP